MSAMYRLKAYFGMVPAEELAEYADGSVDDHGDHGDRHVDHRADHRADRFAYDRYPGERPSRRDRGDWDDRFTYADDEAPERPRVGDEWERRTSARPEPVRGPSGPPPGIVRGSLAVDPDSVSRPALAPALAPVPAAVPEQRDRAGAPRITTLQPSSYKEARTIGEHYREGQPVIMNLTELDAADAKRLVDFAAGLAFALRGSIDKVTNRVFLLTPADVEVSADDARRLAQRSVFRAD
jgi:cell division inhibitor SepF